MKKVTVAIGKPKTAVPPHVPADRVVDFDIFNPPDIDTLGVHIAWAKLQQSTPHELVWTPYNEGHWIALRGKRVRAIYRDPAHFSSRNIWIPKSEGENYGLIPTKFDPPEHTPFREVLNRAVGISATKEMEPQVRAIAVAIIEGIVPLGHCDFVDAYSKQFPVRVFLSLLDLPYAHADEVRGWLEQLTRPDGSMSMDEVMANFFAYVDPIIDQRVGKDGHDLISRMVNHPLDGRAMSRDEMRGLVSQLLIAGLDTVVNILGFFMEFLARNPDHRRQLVDEPKLIRKGIEELFRRFPVVAVARMVREDSEWDGIGLKAGEMVHVPTLVGGVDDRMNECPMHVNFHRKRISNITFGDGPHICAGQHFARLEAIVTLEEWLKRIPEFEIAPGETVSHKSGIISTVERLPLVWTTSFAS